MKNSIPVSFEKLDKGDFTPSVALKVYTSRKIAHVLCIKKIFISDFDLDNCVYIDFNGNSCFLIVLLMY